MSIRQLFHTGTKPAQLVVIEKELVVSESGVRNWYGLAGSWDGKKLVASVFGGGDIYFR